MNKLAVFPITYDLLTVLRFKDLIGEYQICSINSFKEDILLEQLKKEYPECIVSSDVNLTISEVERVLLLDNEINFTLNKYKKILQMANQLKKEVLLSRQLVEKIEVGNTNNIKIVDNSFEQRNAEQYYKKINVPVIAICGLGENCSKFEMLLNVLQTINEYEYTVIALSGNSLISLFGGYTFPEYIYRKDVSLEEKINCLNRDICELIKKENPDLLLIEIPGGIIPLAECQNNHFSEIPLVIANAIDIDVGILNIFAPFQKDEDNYKYLKEYCDYKYKIPIEGICMARQKVEYERENRKCNYLFLDEKCYEKLYGKYCCNSIIKLTDKEQIEMKIKEILNLLEGNAEFI